MYRTISKVDASSASVWFWRLAQADCASFAQTNFIAYEKSLEIILAKPRAFGYTRNHLGANTFAFVEGEDKPTSIGMFCEPVR